MSLDRSPVLGLPLFHNKRFVDSRGFFVAPFQESRCLDATIPKIIQVNHSRSKKNVLRGLHYQYPHFQGKLVYITRGQVLDVVVDIRYGSPTFGVHETFLLNDENHTSLYIPPGFAHGFLALSEDVDFLYFVTHAGYHPQDERTLIWNDPTLGIDWKAHQEKLIISPKDQEGLTLNQLKEKNELPEYS